MLIDWSDGDDRILDDLIPVVDGELRRLAHTYIRNLRPGGMFQTTALINEAYIRLVDQKSVKWQNRAHFYAISAYMMRRVLLNHIRDQKRIKRGAGAIHVSLSGVAVSSRERSVELQALDEALTRLAKIDKRKSEVVELKFFAGLSVEETAEVLKVSKITVNRDWKFARAWLAREMRNDI